MMAGESGPFGTFPTVDKRRELASYRALKLARSHKSRAGRRRIEEAQLYRFAGKGSEDQPYLKVTRSEYFRVWHECADRLRLELAELGFDPVVAFPLQREKHERMVYHQLAEDALRAVRSEAAFERWHGRPMTPHERDLLARERGAVSDGEPAVPAGEPGRRVRQMQMAQVLGSIERAARQRPSLLQEMWSGLVGPAVAAEVTLESVDPAAGVVYCRCLNAGLAYDLRRRRSLPAKLGDALGMRIERIVFR